MDSKKEFYLKSIGFSLIWLILFVCICLFAGCKAKQPPLVEKTEIITTDDKTLSVNTELEKSRAINDSLFSIIGRLRTAKPECDSVCNEALQRQLESFNNRKVSGGNEFGVYYDRYRKMLVAYAKLEETVSKRKDSIRTEYRTITEYKEKPVLVPAVWTKWDRFFYWTGLVFWPVLILFLGYRFSRIFR